MAVRKTQKPRPKGSSNALEQLIGQFSQPLAFLRELVQNSLDASTELIEVEVDFDAESGCCLVRVKDTGMGMTQDIIDNQLTRLFASSKENDLTKIGKFGIGFVSIFAIQPKLVVVETGRDGECWRLLFKPDRSFERRQLQYPVEGTSVTVFIPKGKNELADLQRECRETMEFWCKHSDVEIQFNGQPINQPFELKDVGYQYRHKVEGTETVVAPCPEERGFQGYYNRGLTLLEGPGSPLPQVRFKLRSRYLEHTLSRDNILCDDNYEKAMLEVREAAYKRMPRDLLGRLAERDEPQLWAAARQMVKYPGIKNTIADLAVFAVQGQRFPLAKLPQTLYVHPHLDDFSAAATAAGNLVMTAGLSDEKLLFLSDIGLTILALENHFLYYQTVLEPSVVELEFMAEMTRACRALGPIVLVSTKQAPARWRSQFCAHLNPSSEVALEPRPDNKRGTCISLFREHPFWGKSLKLYRVQPELAVSLVIRKITLDLGLGAELGVKLFHHLVKSLRAREVES